MRPWREEKKAGTGEEKVFTWEIQREKKRRGKNKKKESLDGQHVEEEQRESREKTQGTKKKKNREQREEREENKKKTNEAFT